MKVSEGRSLRILLFGYTTTMVSLHCIALSQYSSQRLLQSFLRIAAMATPPDSGGIFLSSSPTNYSSGSSEEVDVLLARARMVDCLSQTIDLFITTHRNAFFKTFERRVNLIRSRSQALQDSHVTVFDKVLLELTQNGHRLDHPAAIQYFCEEFLAIPINASSEQKTAILSDAVVASVPVLPGKMLPLLLISSVLTNKSKP